MMTNVVDLKTKAPSPSRDDIDAAMLESMATAFRMMGHGHGGWVSFNSFDMADLLDRCRTRIQEPFND